MWTEIDEIVTREECESLQERQSDQHESPARVEGAAVSVAALVVMVCMIGCCAVGMITGFRWLIVALAHLGHP
jgi:hypothetical protein